MSSTDLFQNAPKLFQEICKLYNKTETEVNEDVEIIKKWLHTQHHLPEIMRDGHIRNFLIINKFSIEKTKQKIDNYYTIRSIMPEIYDDCNPKSPRMKKLYANGVAGIHPHLLQNKYTVYIAMIRDLQSVFLPEETLMVACDIAEVRFHEDCFFYDVYIIDAKYAKLSDAARVTPSYLLKTFTVLEKVYSFRLKAVHVINAPSYVLSLMNMVKKVLKPKIADRVHFYGDEEILKELFTIDTLPKDYGGYGPSLQDLFDMMMKKFDQYQDRFDELDKLRVDESRRPEKLVNDENLGFYGNFKRLSVD